MKIKTVVSNEKKNQSALTNSDKNFDTKSSPILLQFRVLPYLHHNLKIEKKRVYA